MIYFKIHDSAEINFWQQVQVQDVLQTVNQQTMAHKN